MENITTGQIAVALAFIVAIAGSVQSLRKSIREVLANAMKDKFEALEKSQKEIIARLDSVDIENCKNYIVTFLSEISRGEPKDDIEIQRFWEEYEHYVKRGGNSYVMHKVDDLKKRGIL